jgi:hypothetical protein
MKESRKEVRKEGTTKERKEYNFAQQGARPLAPFQIACCAAYSQIASILLK